MTKLHEEVAKRRGLVRLPEATDAEHKETAIKFLASSKERGSASTQVLIVTSPLFFMQRDVKMRSTGEFSQKVLDAVQARFVNIVVMCAIEDRAAYETLFSQWPFVAVCWIDKQNVRTTMISVVKTLQERGLQLYLPSNPRELSWLNIKKYLGAQKAEVVGADDHARIGITPDKELNFKELAKQRSRTGW